MRRTDHPHADHTGLTPRDLLILSSLAERPSHGYGLIRRVEEKSEGNFSLDPANLYRVLRRMRRLGWIREQEDAHETDSRRRIMEITAEGRSTLRGEVRRMEVLLRQTRPALPDLEEG